MDSTQSDNTAELVKRLVEQGLELVRTERSRINSDLLGAAREASRSLSLFGAAGILAMSSFTTLCLGAGMALARSSPRPALVVGAVLGTGSAVCVALGIGALPKHALAPLRQRLTQDVKAAAAALH